MPWDWKGMDVKLKVFCLQKSLLGVVLDLEAVFTKPLVIAPMLFFLTFRGHFKRDQNDP